MNDFEKDNKKEFFIGLIFLVLCLVAGLYALFLAGKMTLGIFEYAEAKRATAECYKLEEYSRTFKGAFYLTKGEKMQCDYYKIEIDAPVK